jgi:hypothetical protein
VDAFLRCDLLKEREDVGGWIRREEAKTGKGEAEKEKGREI